MKKFRLDQTKHHFIKANTKGRDFVVGDLHGHYKDLTQALEKIKFNKNKDRLFSVGDMINRGPDNVKCLKLLQKKWFFAVLGNHEILMLNALMNDQCYPEWIKKGGHWFEELPPKKQDKIRRLIKKYLSKLPHSLTIQSKNMSYGICHADPPRNWRRIQKNKCLKQLIWGRSRIRQNYKKTVKNIDRVFVGHTNQKRVKILGNVIYLDTAVYKQKGYLSLVNCITLK